MSEPSNTTTEDWRAMTADLRAVRDERVISGSHPLVGGDVIHAAFNNEFIGALAGVLADTPEGRKAWATALKAVQR